MELTDKAYDRDQAFWDTYIKGRPTAPASFFERIYKYHEEHGGSFNIVHDAGAGVGPYSAELRKKFSHVIVSDIVASSIKIAQSRLGTNGFTYRHAKIEDADDIAAASVDMVFASNVMHFPDVELAQKAIARQLRPGGTFVCGGFGIAQYRNLELQDLWTRMLQLGLRVQARNTKERARRLLTYARIGTFYNHVPMDEEYFLPGAQRIQLSDSTGWGTLLPEDLMREVESPPPIRVGPNDEIITNHEPGWEFKTDIQGIRDQFNSMSFAASEPEAYVGIWREMEELIGDGREVEGWWPARVFLATRK